jgi:hypothetical protein
MPNASNETAIKRVELGLQLLTAMLIVFAAGLVSLQLSVRFGAGGQLRRADLLTGWWSRDG